MSIMPVSEHLLSNTTEPLYIIFTHRMQRVLIMLCYVMLCREYAELQRAVHTVASLQRVSSRADRQGSEGDRQGGQGSEGGFLTDDERSRSENEAREWDMVWGRSE
jgi:hypothetical protein